jgi:hypothetical protein
MKTLSGRPAWSQVLSTCLVSFGRLASLLWHLMASMSLSPIEQMPIGRRGHTVTKARIAKGKASRPVFDAGWLT